MSDIKFACYVIFIRSWLLLPTFIFQIQIFRYSSVLGSVSSWLVRLWGLLTGTTGWPRISQQIFPIYKFGKPIKPFSSLLPGYKFFLEVVLLIGLMDPTFLVYQLPPAKCFPWQSFCFRFERNEVVSTPQCVVTVLTGACKCNVLRQVTGETDTIWYLLHYITYSHQTHRPFSCLNTSGHSVTHQANIHFSIKICSSGSH